METQKTILKSCLEKGFLLDKELLGLVSGLDEASAKDIIDSIGNLKIPERVITKTLLSKNFERIRNILYAGKNKTIIEKFFVNLGYIKVEISEAEEQKIEGYSGKVKLLYSPVLIPKKIVVEDFVKHFRARYGQIKNILQERNLENLTAIRRIGEKKEACSIIACVFDKNITKNKNLILTVEDPTGKVKVLINANKKDLYLKAKDLLLDDIVAFNVSGNKEILFCNDLTFPDAAIVEKKKSKEEGWIAFSSDVHVGSKMFLEDNFLKFIKWLNGEEGDEKQREIAKKVKYLFLTGDCIDGVGVFPDQETLLKIKDIKEQYKKLAEYLKLIRRDIKIILSPGQHDAVRVAEPQPIVDEEFAPELHKIHNLTLAPNPALVQIDIFKVLMYHGASMHGVIGEIEDLRLNSGHDTPTKVAQELLKRRHLAPTHGSVVYIPNEKEDPLMIQQIPDIFATGDLHRPEVSSYNNILLIASSCWQSVTPFEEKVGNHPDPCKVPLFNMMTREIKILDFGDNESEHVSLEGEKIEIKQEKENVLEVKK